MTTEQKIKNRQQQQKKERNINTLKHQVDILLDMNYCFCKAKIDFKNEPENKQLKNSLNHFKNRKDYWFKELYKNIEKMVK